MYCWTTPDSGVPGQTPVISNRPAESKVSKTAIIARPKITPQAMRLIERLGLRANARHRALADAQLIHQFWQKIHVDRSIEEIEVALRAQNAHPSLPPHLDPGIVDARKGARFIF